MAQVIAVVLAAGEGKRMGMPKALLEHEKGRSFLGQLLKTFDKAGARVLAVVGKDATLIRGQHPEADLVENPSWEDGQWSSVRVGLRAALEDGAEYILVHPVDMPLIRPTTVSAILKAVTGTQVEGVVPEFEGAAGHPLALTRAAAERILAMEDTSTLEAAQKKLSILRLRTKDPAVMVDLNTPEVYTRVLGVEPHLAPPPKRRGKKVDAGEPAEPPEP
jgi:molybdenum cofactor cytidylyltransferase